MEKRFRPVGMVRILSRRIIVHTYLQYVVFPNISTSAGTVSKRSHESSLQRHHLYNLKVYRFAVCFPIFFCGGRLLHFHHPPPPKVEVLQAKRQALNGHLGVTPLGRPWALNESSGVFQASSMHIHIAVRCWDVVQQIHCRWIFGSFRCWQLQASRVYRRVGWLEGGMMIVGYRQMSCSLEQTPGKHKKSVS